MIYIPPRELATQRLASSVRYSTITEEQLEAVRTGIYKTFFESHALQGRADETFFWSVQ